MKKTRQSTDRYVPIITAMLRDIQTSLSAVYTPRSAELDSVMIRVAVERNGMDVLTKHLPALGKAFDRALSGEQRMSQVDNLFIEAFKLACSSDQLALINFDDSLIPACQLPVLFRDLFQRVFDSEGTVLPNSDVDCVRAIRQLCFTFYKLQLPYSLEEEQKVIDQFVKTESDISSYNKLFSAVADSLDYDATQAPLKDAPDPIRSLGAAYMAVQPSIYRDVIRDARRLLMRLFQRFDPKAIVPCHGPGAVSSKEKLHEKFIFKRINPRIDEEYPFSEYFLASGGALVDNLHKIYAYSNVDADSFVYRRLKAKIRRKTDPSYKVPLTKELSSPPNTASENDVVKWALPALLTECEEYELVMDNHEVTPVYTGPSDSSSAFNASCMSVVSVPVAANKYGDYRYQNVPVVGEYPARVILVPKDSRGPRLISCEPLENQAIQQGLSSAIVRLVERSPLTRYNVHFTDQEPNRRGALVGSIDGRYATLDLKEASDRVTVGLVRLLFPEPLLKCLLAVRTTSTVLPSGVVQNLDKYAPMGSALCFPVMALSIWALLTALFRDDVHAKQSMLVYGDDVIVPGNQAQNAIACLESFGLAINRDKSCVSGLFRESCGRDAYKGKSVTPVRIRTLWTSRPSPKSYLSYIEYSNSFRRNGYINVSEEITKWLCRLYGEVPCKDMMLNVPALDVVPESHRPRRKRYNKDLQKSEYYVYSPKAQVIKRTLPGWSMLLRYFWETSDSDRAPGMYLSDYLSDKPRRRGYEELNCVDYMIEPFSVRSYTPRDAVVLAKSWR